ncbi:protein phosphatase 2C domain-containing protein [Rheinheimera sp. YQF-2]|uniref:Protein phosphatase 2C domain-containing protein n=1 Tax=Rheinheimera lutimaris TaxID=2740584 RepID=A0A7Y5ANI6_9GAMM|nr:protein phosphatase 2C domain-containing protein [Rheinheimera lutimaris]NRQ41621.1 protein phosphatase 2C domain-containing protein [Rheinheimera lutimaris]
MPYQLAILQLSGFNVTGGKWSQQDALGYAADGGVPTLLQQDDVINLLDLQSPDLLLLVADGVSASPAAASASYTVIKYLLQHWPGTGFSSRQLRLAQQYLADTLGRKRQSFGAATTVAALQLSAERFVAINAGDSRIWRLRNLQLQQLSEDHDWQNDSAELRQQTGLAQCYRALTSYLAADSEAADFTVSVTDGALQTGDQFVLTTDGVHDLVTAEELAELFAVADFATALQQLQSLLLLRGAPDNASLLWLFPIPDCGDC